MPEQLDDRPVTPAANGPVASAPASNPPWLTLAASGRPLPTHLDLPFESEDDVPPDGFDFSQARLLTDVIEWWIARRRPGFQCSIGHDHFIYWDITTPPNLGAKAPDWFLVPGVPRVLPGAVHRNSYVLWQERVPPEVVMEFVSSTAGGEWDTRTGKFWVYEQGIRANHYAIFDRRTNQLDAYRLVNGRYQAAQPNGRGHFPVEALGLEYGLLRCHFDAITRVWVRWWDQDGTLLPTPEEFAAVQRLETEHARQQAEGQVRQKRKLADKLRELGIDPDTL
jgi:Uma2 family endonuclease